MKLPNDISNKNRNSDILRSFLGKVFPFVGTPRFSFILILVGIILRLKYYLENCSLCPDESYVAIEIVHRSWEEIFNFISICPSQPIHPLFFILAIKSAVVLFGNSEYSLRLIPILSGVLSVIFFYRLLKKSVPPLIQALALALFVFCDQLIYFSAELKPYATDVLAAILLYLFFEKSRRKKFGLWLATQWGIIGAVTMWLSSTSIFILGGLGIAGLISFANSRQWKSLGFLSITFILWLESFTPLYYFSFRPMTTNSELIGMWEHCNPFMSYPLWSFKNILWLKSVFLQMFSNPLGLPLTYFAALIFLAGCYQIFRADRMRFAAYSIPLLLTLLAAMLRKYPFNGRMLLFLAPVLFIFIAEGIGYLAGKFKAKASWLVAVAAGLLLYYPIFQAGYFLAHTRCTDQGRLMMQYLEENYQPGEGGLIYLSADSAYPFAYYASQTKFNEALPVSFFSDGDQQKLKGVKWGRFPYDIGGDKANPYVELLYEVYTFDEQGWARIVLTSDWLSRPHKIFYDTSDDFLDHRDAWVYIAYSQPEAKKIILNFFDTHARRVKQFEAGDTGLYLFSFDK